MAPARRQQEEGEVCPLCIEVLDPTERTYYPCPCGYQVCLFCLDRIKQDCGSLCPGCRTVYGVDHDPFKKRVPAADATSSGESASTISVVPQQGRKHAEHTSRHQPSSSPTQPASHLRRQQSSSNNNAVSGRQNHRHQSMYPSAVTSPISNRQAQRQDRRAAAAAAAAATAAVAAASSAATAQQHQSHQLQQQQQHNHQAGGLISKRQTPQGSPIMRPPRSAHARISPMVSPSVTSASGISANVPINQSSQISARSLPQQLALPQHSAPQQVDSKPLQGQHASALYHTGQSDVPQLLLPAVNAGFSSNLGAFSDGLWAPPQSSFSGADKVQVSPFLDSSQMGSNSYSSRQGQSGAYDPWASSLWPTATSTGGSGSAQTVSQPARQSRLAQYAQLSDARSAISSTFTTPTSIAPQQQRSQQEQSLPPPRYNTGTETGFQLKSGLNDFAGHSRRTPQAAMPNGHNIGAQCLRFARPLEPLRLDGNAQIPELSGARAQREKAHNLVVSGKQTPSDAAWHLVHWLNQNNKLSAQQEGLHCTYF